MTTPTTTKQVIFVGTFFDLQDAIARIQAKAADDNAILDALCEVYPEPADSGTATELVYGVCDLEPDIDGLPADPREMYQKGWVCNSRRAAIKQEYERRLHREYNALFTDRRDTNK